MSGQYIPMRTDTDWNRRVFAALLSLIVGNVTCDGAGSHQPPSKLIEVEVAPGRFVNVERRDWTVDDRGNTSGREKTALTIEFSGRTVHWEGPEIPVVLREGDGILYMAGYDRETGRLNGDNIQRYTYFRQEGDRLVQIDRTQFPKELATQNMWLREKRKLEAVLNLNTADPWFRSSSNAFIWEDLMTGKCADQSGVDKDVLDEFAQKYKPIRLTTIKREHSD